MASIAAVPFIIKNTTLSLGANDYSSAISQAELIPTSPSSPFKSINGISYSFAGYASWVLTVTFAQDWVGATTLAAYLFNNETNTVAFSIKPTPTSAGFTGNVVLTPGNIGGTADGTATSTVTFNVIGKPVLVPAA